MRLFDECVMVDWSAASSPKRGKDSVWVGWGDGGAETRAENCATRPEARSRVRELLQDALRRGARVLVGFDFPYGYPRGFARSLGVSSSRPWLHVWEELARSVEDDERNRNNRFSVAAALNARVGSGPGPFWGCPPAQASETLAPTKLPFPQGGLPEYRAVEASLRERPGRATPLSAWQLMYSGCVGSQALVGIPVIHALRFDPELEGLSRVWPFETGFRPAPSPPEGPFVLHAEIWPGVIALDVEPGQVRDEAQVKALVLELSRRDRAGSLGELFDPAGADKAAEREEGWILGA